MRRYESHVVKALCCTVIVDASCSSCPFVVESSFARAISIARSRSLSVISAARRNSARACSWRPSFDRINPRARPAAGGRSRGQGCPPDRRRFESRGRAVRHRDGHRAIQLDDRRRHDRRQLGVDRRDPRPVGLIGRPGARVARGDRGLQRGPVPARRSIPPRARGPRGRAESADDPTARAPDRAAGWVRRLVRHARRIATPAAPSTQPARALRPHPASGPRGTRPIRSASSHSAGRIQSDPDDAA